MHISMKAGDSRGDWELVELFRDHRSRKKWHCRCVCGTPRVIFEHTLREGRTLSCGCTRPNRITTAKIRHGEARHESRTKEYYIWANMLTRCYNKKNFAYKDYGKRGIKVARHWWRYENFLVDVGRCPGEGFSLDRFPHNDGNYEPGNVRWATKEEQANNKRSNVLITFAGRTMSRTQWSRETGLPSNTIALRLGRLGWSIEEALTTPRRLQRAA